MDSDTPIAQPIAPPPPRTYELLPAERQVLINLQQNAVQRKLTVYELNMQLEQAQLERDRAQALFSGALAMLSNSHGMPEAEINTELTVIKVKVGPTT